MPAATRPGTASTKKRRSHRRGPQPQKSDPGHGELRDPGEHDGVGEQCADVRPLRQAETRDRRQRQQEDGIECHDAEGRGGDAPLGVEHCGDDRDRAGERDIGRRNPHVVRRQGATLASKARREHVDHRRRE
jgi:hypothetical protein